MNQSIHTEPKGGFSKVGLLVPILFWLLALFALADPMFLWLGGDSRFEQNAIKEWLEEARVSRRSLPELVEAYLRLVPAKGASVDEALDIRWQSALVRREEIKEHLRALGEPVSKLYPDQLPLFPFLFRMEVVLDSEPLEPIWWDSGIACREDQVQKLAYRITPRSSVKVLYQLHAFDHRRELEKERFQRGRWLLLIATTLAVGVSIQALWAYRRERNRQRQTEIARAQAQESESLRLQAEKQLLSQQLLAKAAESDALELRSQMYAGIGIMAGSYAHNIKNMLVRPSDLLRRARNAPGQSAEIMGLLNEVEETLGAVGDRLSQILGTLRRSPDKYEPVQVDLVKTISSMVDSWKMLAMDKWKIALTHGDMPLESAMVMVDPSHLQQVLENLIFNARDAIFERRAKMREAAREIAMKDSAVGRQDLLKASEWVGAISIHLEPRQHGWLCQVSDNGAGMTPETLLRCTESYYSTRRQSAIFEGMSSGMGLGLSFVKTVLQRAGAELSIESVLNQGTSVSIRFSSVEALKSENVQGNT